jgi:sulfur-carrier protein
VNVLIPSALASYVGGRAEAQASGSTVGELLLDLDRQFPGLRFRVVDEQDAIRTHMRIFVNGEIARLATPVTPAHEIAIPMAMSGGQDRVDDHRGDAAATMFPDD